MKASSKELRSAVLLFAAALLAGILIQVGLKIRTELRAEHAAENLLGSVLAELEAEDRILEAQRTDAIERMRTLPLQKKERLEDLELDLLTVVNPWNPLEEGYEPALATVVEEYQMDARCASVVWQMMQDCRESGGGYPMICSAYRTQEFQQELFDNKVIRVQQERWCSLEEATRLAAEEVAVPGTSEHQLGLAADIIDETYPYLTEWQETTPTQHWLAEHAADYGFILRYPAGTSDITGIIYEPWHYRYVGVKFAKEITNRGLTLEEYVAWRRGR